TGLVVLVVGFALAALSASGVVVADARAALGALAGLAAALVACVGAVVALVDSGAAQRRAAFEQGKQGDVAEVRRSELEARFHDRLHEVRSTVLAIEGGVRVLQPVVPRANAAAVTEAL